jgi:hypothetical protein
LRMLHRTWSLSWFPRGDLSLSALSDRGKGETAACGIISPLVLQYNISNKHSWALADDPVINASRLSEADSGKIYGLKWRKGEPLH